MNEQQGHRMAVETDKELSDLLDFSAVRRRKSECVGVGPPGGLGVEAVWSLVWLRKHLRSSLPACDLLLKGAAMCE